ncbi:unnamed protein product [Ectocarpus sp. 12 AP-2014]
MSASVPCSPAAKASAATTAAGGSARFGLRSPAGSGSGASQIPSPPSSSCSDGLRRAARLALRKKDLMSPTLKRLLQDPSQLQMAAGRAGGDETRGEGAYVGSPSSEESELGKEDYGRVGGAGSGGRMTPSELRGSTSWTLPFTARSDSVGGDGSDACLSSCCSSSSGSDGEGQEQDGGGTTRLKRMNLPNRKLFRPEVEEEEEEEEEEEKEQLRAQQQSPKQQRTSAIARAAATASAARYAALEMRPPPPRAPTAAKASAAAGGDGLSWPSSSPHGGRSKSVICTPTKGILSGGPGKGFAATEGSSTVKRRVRFEMEKAERMAAEEACLASPCRSSSSLSPGWGGSRAASAGEEGGGGGEERRGKRSAWLRPFVVSALAVTLSVGAVAFLGGEGQGKAPGPIPDGSCSPVRLLPWLEEQPQDLFCPVAAAVEPVTAERRTDGGNVVGPVEGEPAGVLAERDELAEEEEDGEEAAGAVFEDDAAVSSSGKVVEVGTQEVKRDGDEEQRQQQQQHEQEIRLEEEEEEDEDEEDEEKEDGQEDLSTAAAVAAAPEAVAADDEQQQQAPPAPQHHHQPYPGEAEGASANPAAAVRSSATVTRPKYRSPVSPAPAPAPAPASMWGWFEVGAAVFVALALLAAVAWRSLGGGDVEDCGEFDGGGGEAPATPTHGGDGGGETLGRYQTVELVKKGDTPATLRSVKRSYRIGSSQASPRSGTMIMDLGPGALDMSSA